MKTNIQTLRHLLHQHPELSGQEEQTAARIKAYLQDHAPTRLITNLGGHGVAALFEFSPAGPTVMIRCELDALPIPEQNTFEHRSLLAGVAHKCGHDGHMAIVAGLAPWIQEQAFEQGRIILLFQPAEETGQGAAAVLADERWPDLTIDYAFALHNIPGEALHSVLLMEPGFSAEVQSFAIKLTGQTAHAAEPENGNNPAVAIAQLVLALEALNEADTSRVNFRLLTPVYLKMGEQSYGVSPGIGALHYTIRTWTEEGMDALVAEIEAIVERICGSEKIHFELDWFEHFPASANESGANAIVAAATQSLGLELKQMPHPFKFGEDFGWFSRKYPAAMFGLGAGLNTPALHHADYDFPDELLPTGMALFRAIIRQILG